MGVIQDIVNDTMKERSGKWSKKALQAFASFVISVLIGIFIVISDYFFDESINSYAIMVFGGFLGLAGHTGSLILRDKMHNRDTIAPRRVNSKPNSHDPLDEEEVIG